MTRSGANPLEVRRMVSTVCWAAAALLVASGLAKLRAPAPAAAMITRLVPRLTAVRTVLVRAIGVGEIGVGALVLAVGGRIPAALLALAYLCFAAVAVRLLAGGERGSCGCFGAADSPIGIGHVVLDVVGLAAGVAGVVRPIPAVGTLGGITGVITAAQVVLLAWLGYLAITSLPALAALRRLEDSR